MLATLKWITSKLSSNFPNEKNIFSRNLHIEYYKKYSLHLSKHKEHYTMRKMTEYYRIAKFLYRSKWKDNSRF